MKKLALATALALSSAGAIAHVHQEIPVYVEPVRENKYKGKMLICDIRHSDAPLFTVDATEGHVDYAIAGPPATTTTVTVEGRRWNTVVTNTYLSEDNIEVHKLTLYKQKAGGEIVFKLIKNGKRSGGTCLVI